MEKIINENLILAQNGDKEAYSKVIEEIKIQLYKTAIAILKNDDDACDAIQETLISAYQNLSSLRNNDFFKTWITRILINKCNDIIRKNKKIIDITEKLSKETNTFYAEYSKKSELESILNNIGEELRLVTVLYYYDDFSIKDISEMINIPEGTVKSRLSRAREKIAKIYNIGGEEVG